MEGNVIASTIPIPECSTCKSSRWIFLGVKGGELDINKSMALLLKGETTIKLKCTGCREIIELEMKVVQ